jgi:hypothetical protein
MIRRRIEEKKGRGTRPAPPPPAGGESHVLRGRGVTGDEIVDLLQSTPELLQDRWTRANDEEKPLRAKQVSWAEIEIVIGKRSN